jgi:fatty acid desaturase
MRSAIRADEESMDRDLSPEECQERRDDPTALTRFFFRCPWLAGAACGAVLAGWVLVLGAIWPVALFLGVAMFFWTGIVWRRAGPGQRWRRYMLRRFPKRTA